MDEHEMAAYRSMIQENVRYDDFVQEHPWDVGRLDEMVELMVETVCSTRRSIRIAGNDIPQAVVKSRLLKLDGEHIRFVFDCLQRNPTEIRNASWRCYTMPLSPWRTTMPPRSTTTFMGKQRNPI